MIFEEKPSLDELVHYGMPRRSGRYPWGSGKDPYQRSSDFLSRVEELSKEGFSEKEIADSMGLTTTQFRVQKSLAKDERRSIEVARAKGLREKGYSLKEIAKEMGYANDSSIRSLLDEGAESRMNQAKNTAKFLKKQVDEKEMIDVGTGVERELNISKEKLNQALYMLELEGYKVYGRGIPQATNPGKQTNVRILCKPGIDHKDIYDSSKIKSITNYVSHDDGQTFDTFVYPKSMDIKRLGIRYAEDGGTDKDGVIEIRRGVKDLSLGGSHYAQVRILVDNDRYLKGMAVYSDDLPDGVDVLFNTNKSKKTAPRDVMKEIKDDPDNPFGSLIKAGGQSYYTDEKGNRQLSLINKRADEGDWGDWSDKLPSQFLSKQNLNLIKRQLNIAAETKQHEYEEIMKLTNPVVKASLLKSFSDDCDAAAVHLQAASLPGQKYQVILPVTSMKDTEVYAPNYNNGDKLALVRFPHGGTFEIPILTVNNKHADAKRMIGANALDAVGINSKVAERLSGADFDGDTVMVIPIKGSTKITSTPPLKGLEGFDPKMAYPERPGMKYMKNTQTEMGKISNLITDMTILGANQDELARAVRHSMVVIDAAKHKLDYKQSEIDNGIASLKKKYQGRIDPETGQYKEGAITIISRAKGEVSVTKRQGSPIIDPETGKQYWKDADNPTYEKKVLNKRTGEITTKTVTKTQKSTKMFETDDARTLLSPSNNPKELAYADYANKMKALANQARKSMINTPPMKYDPHAKQKYMSEVETLNAKVNVALMNAPKERRAQTLANSIVQAKKDANPDLTSKELKKIGQQALDQTRRKVGAKRELVYITDKEWEAIQAGAISAAKLKTLLNNADMDRVKQLATPRNTNELDVNKVNRIKALSLNGYTNSEIANKLGVSVSTIRKYL